MVAATDDPRVEHLEENLLALLRLVPGAAPFGTDAHPDAATYHHRAAFPLFNVISGATFVDLDADTVARRAAEINAPYVERGRPFLWWTTPSTTSPALDAALRAAGFEVHASPGMHLELAWSAPQPPPDGLRITRVGDADRRVFGAAMLAGFEMPPDLLEPYLDLERVVPSDTFADLLAFLDGRPVAGGSAWVTGETVGLFNIFTLPEVRGRRIGSAVTAALVELGSERGCTRSTLTSTESGLHVYERLGYRAVCEITQYIWSPA